MITVTITVSGKHIDEAVEWLKGIDHTIEVEAEARPNGRDSQPTLSTTPLRAKPGTKIAKVEVLLRRGAVGEELRRAVGWPFNIPHYAKLLKYELHTKKVKRNGRRVKFYWVGV